MEDKTITSEKIDSKTFPYPYVISLPKLIIMSITTLGLFEIYWFYKQFKSFKAERNWKNTPWLRALFSGIMSYSLFRQVSEAAGEYDQKRKLKPGGLWAFYFILNSLWRLPDPYWLITFLSFLPLMETQISINFYWKKKYGDKIVQSPFGTANYVWAIIGGIFLLLALVGTFLPE